MKFPIIIVVPALRVEAVAIFPFILVKRETLKHDEVMIRHELIHFRQEIELLIIPFYILYLVYYLINLVRFKDHDKAYRYIIFEREAYAKEKDQNYLIKRRFWAWANY